jgi:hypothetical protein
MIRLVDDLLIVTLALLGSTVGFLAKPFGHHHFVCVKAARRDLEPLPESVPAPASIPDSERGSERARGPGLATA